MKPRHWLIPRSLTVFAFLILCQIFTVADAADVRLDVSSEDAFVDFPVTVRMTISNVSRHDPPTIDPVDGLEIESLGSSGQSSRVVIVNGRRTASSSVVYQWSVTPTREGNFTIPPVKVRADELTSITNAVRLRVTKAEAGDLVITEIERHPDQIYAGQPLELTLKVYVKAYQDDQNGIRVDPSSFWAMLARQSQWGLFADTLENLRMNRMQPRGVPVVRKDADGNDADYYLYQVDATFYPSRPGPIRVNNDVKIIMEYPLAIQTRTNRDQSRSLLESMFQDDLMPGGSLLGRSFLDDAFFRGQRSTHQVTQRMPIAIRPEMKPVSAKAIPTDGQPDDFTGAVGRYVIETRASPSSVQAGDPIELTIRIQGTGVMESVVAPPLSKSSELTDRFRVTSQSLAGQVSGDSKTFVTTLRPLDPSVTEIPAIPFTYFNPDAGQYETSYSDPIAISVSPADVLELATAAAGEKDNQPSPALQQSASQNQPAMDLAWRPVPLETQSHQSRWLGIVAAIIIAPLMIVFSGLGRIGFLLTRGRVSESKTIAAIKSAKEPREMMLAMTLFQARKWSVSDDSGEPGATMDQILGRLRWLGHHRYAVRIQQWADRLRKPSGGDSQHFQSLQQTAIQIVTDAKSQRGLPTRVATTMMVGVFTLVALPVPAGIARQPNAEKQTIAPEGDGASASDASSPESVDSPQDEKEKQKGPSESIQSESLVRLAREAYLSNDFPSAVFALQSCLNVGLSNPDLHLNLANAYRQLDQPAQAKAHYLSAIQLDPFGDAAKRSLISLDATDPYLAAVLKLPLNVFLILAIIGWMAVCMTFALRFWTSRFRWKTVATLSLLGSLASGVVVAAQLNHFWRPQHAVLVAEQIEMRRGDDLSFETVPSGPMTPGQVVRWIDKRPGWVQIETDRAVRGWVTRDQVEMIRTPSGD